MTSVGANKRMRFTVIALARKKVCILLWRLDQKSKAKLLGNVGWFKSFNDSRFAHYTVVVVFVKRMENK